MAEQQCPHELIDKTGVQYRCSSKVAGHKIHAARCGDGESCDMSQPEPDFDDNDYDYQVETVDYMVMWPAPDIGDVVWDPDSVRKQLAL